MAYIKKDRRDDEQRPRGDRKTAGAPRGDKPERRSTSSDRGDKKPYGDRPERRTSSDRGDRKPYGDRPDRPSAPLRDRGDKKPYGDRGDRKPYGDRPTSDRGERKPYGDRPTSDRGDRKPYGDRPERRTSSDRPERKPYGDRPTSDRGERKPYGDRPTSDRGDRKPYGDRPERRDSKPYGDRPKPNERGSSYSTRPVRSSDENRDGNREVQRDGYKPRSKSFDTKPERSRPERRTKSDKITPHKPGAFDKFDKRFAKPNIKEEIKKERKESRERKVENYERARTERNAERGASTPSRENSEGTERRERVVRAPREREEKVESTESQEGYDRKKTAPNEEIRLNRFIANSGVCSRRKADELIEKGEITINGEVVRELGYKVKYTDSIKYEGKLLKPGKLVYVLLNKPKDYITTMDDPMERRTVIELTAKATSERIFPVGRLDRNTTGLLLLTNDGDLADKLAHPRNQVKKVYEVELDKALTTSDFEIIKNGVELEDGPAKPDQISFLEGKSKKFLGIEIHIGRNRIVRRIFESLGYEVVRLDRVIYAGLSKKDLPRGRHRMLTKEEIIYLKHLNKY
ncbi:MAG: pseudouridine synthase [Sphingobacteriales bacterium]|nr:pseudouridine synthase [Sphingobacteriales bacterium]